MSTKTEGDPPKDYKLTIDHQEIFFDTPNKITFECDEFLLSTKRLEVAFNKEIDIPINLKPIETLIFEIGGEKFTYKKV